MSHFVELHPRDFASRDSRWLINVEAISLVKRINTGGCILVVRQASTVREIEPTESYDYVLEALARFSDVSSLEEERG